MKTNFIKLTGVGHHRTVVVRIDAIVTVLDSNRYTGEDDKYKTEIIVERKSGAMSAYEVKETPDQIFRVLRDAYCSECGERYYDGDDFV